MAMFSMDNQSAPKERSEFEETTVVQVDRAHLVGERWALFAFPRPLLQ